MIHTHTPKMTQSDECTICGAPLEYLDRPLLDEPWDYVITVCGNVEKTCPSFTGYVSNHVHMGFDDPDAFTGSEEVIGEEFLRVRDEIGQKTSAFVKDYYSGY